MSLALALKYRPTTFEDLIGQHAVSQTLSLALDSKHISHAYLFSGLRGSGKTSSARIFSRSLQCDKGPTSKPCGECQNCKAALEGRHLDIIEMDAASSRKIDDIRDLIEQTKYRPAFGRYKIFIIDEVHMLTREAFNALLKTLEEPPEYVKFILATTDPLKLPPTILSRTQHFRFKQIPQRLVVEHIAHILDKEQVRYDTQALEIIARSGSGSLRDTLTLLDQAIIFCKNDIDTSGVTDMLGIVDPQIFSELFGNLLANNLSDIQASIEVLQEYESEMIIDEMILFLKDKLLANDKAYPPLLLDRFFRILTDSKILLAHNTDGSFVLLLTLLKMQEALKIKEIDAMIVDLEHQIFGASTPNATHITANVLPSQPIQNQPQSQSTQNLAQNPTQAPIPKIQSSFEILTQKLYDRNYELGECFARCVKFVSFENDTLTWHSSAEGEDKERLTRHFEIIKAFVAQVFGAHTKISVQKSQPQATQPQATKAQENEANQDIVMHIDTQVNQDMPTNQSAPNSQKAQDREFIEHNKEIVASLEEHLGIKDYFKS